MIITIDGPSGTGKTTVAKLVAERLHFVYFDTGAMYRAFTWFVLQRGVSPRDKEGIISCLSPFQFRIEEQEGGKRYFVGNRDVTMEIRSAEVTQVVSEVVALKEVRATFLLLQHQFGKSRDVVFEGRDLGTVVFPEAKLKVFLTADPSVRAERRLQELVAKHPELTREEVLKDLMRRDELDSTREVAPLRCPPDAYVVDTTGLSIDEVVGGIVRHYEHVLMRSP